MQPLRGRQASNHFIPAATWSILAARPGVRMTWGRCFWTFLNKTFGLVRGRFTSRLLLGFVATSITFLTACPSKTPVAVTPPPSPPQPTATIEAAPASVQAGQAVVITWKTENATDITIDRLGTVPASGFTTVTPSESTTYRLTAKGPGGVQQADAHIAVAVAASTDESMNNSEKWFPEAESTRLDIFFDTDDFSIRSDQFVTIQNDAAFLKQHPGLRIVVEGHCDQMGSTEYNLVLGDRRATEVKSALEKAGVSSSRMRAISYGKEQPFCTEESEACSRLNRRAHITPNVQR